MGSPCHMASSCMTLFDKQMQPSLPDCCSTMDVHKPDDVCTHVCLLLMTAHHILCQSVSAR